MYPGPRKKDLQRDSKRDHHGFVWGMGCFSRRQSPKSEWALGLEKKGRRVLEAWEHINPRQTNNHAFDGSVYQTGQDLLEIRHEPWTTHEGVTKMGGGDISMVTMWQRKLDYGLSRCVAC